MMEAFIQRRRTLESCASVVTDGSWNHAVARFAQGERALRIAHGNYAGRLAEEPLSRVSGRVGYAAAPDAQPLMGGGVLGIVKDSPHAADAAEKELARLCEAALHGAISPETAAESSNAVIPK